MYVGIFLLLIKFSLDLNPTLSLSSIVTKDFILLWIKSFSFEKGLVHQLCELCQGVLDNHYNVEENIDNFEHMGSKNSLGQH